VGIVFIEMLLYRRVGIAIGAHADQGRAGGRLGTLERRSEFCHRGDIFAVATESVGNLVPAHLAHGSPAAKAGGRLSFPTLERSGEVAGVAEAQQKGDLGNRQRRLPDIAQGQFLANGIQQVLKVGFALG